MKTKTLLCITALCLTCLCAAAQPKLWPDTIPINPPELPELPPQPELLRIDTVTYAQGVCLGEETTLILTEENEYDQLVDENLVWSYCDVIKREVDKYDMSYSQIYVKGDTTINGKTYKKVYESLCNDKTTYVAAMREENRKVYALHEQLFNYPEEEMIYNFDLQVGESMPNIYNGQESVYILQSINVIETANGRRKVFDFGSDTWIEGIGSIERALHLPLSPVPLYDLGIRFNYQKQGTQFTYKTDGFWLKEDDCETSKVKNMQTMLPISITQPEHNVLCIVTNEGETFDLKIYDSSGQLQQSILGKSGEYIDITFLSTGIYMLNVNDKAVQKIIKQ